MKIKTTILQSIEAEIAFPIFRKNVVGNDERYFAALNEETVIKWFRLHEYTSYQSGNVKTFETETIEAFTKWETIDEEEFIEAHSKLLESMSLSPKLIQQ